MRSGWWPRTNNPCPCTGRCLHRPAEPPPEPLPAVPTAATTTAPRHTIILPAETLARAEAYRLALAAGQTRPGALVQGCLPHADLAAMSAEELLGCVFATKRPQIFAESAVAGDGSDWNLVELGLLGDISVAVPVTVFDNGSHTAPTPHDQPFPATLVFTPGALLQNGRGCTPADWAEVTAADGSLNAEGYHRLYRRRLLPVLRFINEHAGRPRSALVTLPGLGCGQFAGPFQGRLGAQLQRVLERLLAEEGASLPNLAAVYFDPYNECDNARHELHGITLFVRPLTRPGNRGRTQLCPPAAYGEAGDDFTACRLFSLVAWDHVSWPGNDFYVGSRATDDGVKAAATDALAVLTGVAGRYDPKRSAYQPPPPLRTWEQAVQQGVRERGLRLWHPQALWTPPGG